MKTLRIYIEGDFQDGYLYGGRLFLVKNNGSLEAISLWSIISSNLDLFSEDYELLKMAFSRNNWLTNPQARALFKVKGIKERFVNQWNKLSKNHYHFKIPEERIQYLTDLDSLPIFDLRLYGMRVFIGNRDGLFESGITLNGNYEVKLNDPVSKVFDCRTTNLAAKSGAVMISSNSDGLFHGQFVKIGQRIKVDENPISGKSIKTNWTGYDFMNYNSHNNFEYFKNKYAKTEDRTYLFSPDDEEGSKKVVIEKIGEEVYPMEQVMNFASIGEQEISYAFNSSQSCFFILKNGKFINAHFAKNTNDRGRISSRYRELPKITNKMKGQLRPISSHIIPNGCIIEFFDQVLLVYDNKKTILENNPVVSVRTYPSSIRYRNIITIFDGKGVAIHSVIPF